MYKTFIIIAVISLLGSCSSFRPKVGAPWMQELLKQGPEGGSTAFKLGWRHGCETGISATSNRFQRSFYTFKQDYRLVEDPEYYTAWKVGMEYCQRYVFQWLRRNII